MSVRYVRSVRFPCGENPECLEYRAYQTLSCLHISLALRTYISDNSSQHSTLQNIRQLIGYTKVNMVVTVLCLHGQI